ncbi:MAG: DUF2948 family protein [Rhodospirillaceae bacterium]|jgi:hypothetical protein|nr:DUF2948 family protein [Rhodospirillaceae bacterium]MBT6205266.1 DUF2948 family protein [Rhodospirillaceae bacterium]MBT6512985.1 DUF2948 family protein [Rhodospirillaceae bacterium]MBT7614348.1 DUF2948 family protein [Rhodospirillaceae bacterium]MBT7645752.1 DUF2948 family protein [Rhodospirillaceae bacterium]
MQNQVLKLKATDDDDLEVFSTVLQDAPMPLSEVTHLEDERRFAALFKRFCYEQEHNQMTGHDLLQVHCALVFEKVSSASAWDLGGLGGDGVAELMTIVSEERAGGGVAITLVFHGGGHIRIEADSVEGRLADISEPETADRRPRHTPMFDV